MWQICDVISFNFLNKWNVRVLFDSECKCKCKCKFYSSILDRADNGAYKDQSKVESAMDEAASNILAGDYLFIILFQNLIY